MECGVNLEVPSSIHHNIGLWDFHGVSWVASGIIWPNVRTPLPYIKKKKKYIGGGAGVGVGTTRLKKVIWLTMMVKLYI